MPTKERNLKKIARKASRDFITFVQFVKPEAEIALHHQLLCEKLFECATGVLDNLIISMPPRHGKSFIVSECFPAFLIGNVPDGQTITASYSADLSQRFGTKVKELIRSPLYQAVFPGVLPDDTAKSSKEWITNNNHFVKCTSVGGSITGFGAGIIDQTANFRTGFICDDLIKNRAESESPAFLERLHGFISNDLLTRLLPNAFKIFVGTRWCLDDPQGYLERLQPDLWEVINLPAICIDPDNDPLGREYGQALWEKWYPVEKLHQIKETFEDVRDWYALYQCDPTMETADEVEEIFNSGRFYHSPKQYFSMPNRYYGTYGVKRSVTPWR